MQEDQTALSVIKTPSRKMPFGRKLYRNLMLEHRRRNDACIQLAKIWKRLCSDFHSANHSPVCAWLLLLPVAGS